MPITVSIITHAPLAKVWQAYTTPADIVQWNAASEDWHTTRAEVDLRPGGRFCSRMEARDGSFGFDFEGSYSQVVTHSLIAYAFGDRIAQVRFDEADGQTSVTVTFDPEDSHSLEQQQEGWQAILNSFKKHVEQVKT
jgi:uncharacterized protein YndB with AHSA1/START domain